MYCSCFLGRGSYAIGILACVEDKTRVSSTLFERLDQRCKVGNQIVLARRARGWRGLCLVDHRIWRGISTVLKHGPRSASYWQGNECVSSTPTGKPRDGKAQACTIARLGAREFLVDVKSIRYDPKGHELFLSIVKPGETLVEASTGADVQIARGR